MTIQWNKVTWYSKLLAVILFVLTFYVAFSLGASWGENKTKINPTIIPTITSKGFSIPPPAGYAIDESYTYQALGPGKDIKGIKFTIPASLRAGTNLSSDSYISVETIPGAINSCSAEIYLGNPKSAGFTDENGHRFSVATSSDVAAGNRYDETVYATPFTNGCLAVRYFIHYGAIENYPAGTIKQFDEQALLNQFDKIRHTLVVE